MTTRKQRKRSITRHLFQMHDVRTTDYPVMELEALANLHFLLHQDDYMLPPHSHIDTEMSGADELSEPKLPLGKKYLPGLVKGVIDKSKEDKEASESYGQED